MKSGKKSKLITIVESDTLFFVFLDPEGSQKIIKKIALESFLAQNHDELALPDEVLVKNNALMVIPDYWVGNNYYGFLSKKKSLIAPFVERKLKTDVPGIDEIDDFYGFTHISTAVQDKNLHVYYLQEPAAYEVYHKLSQIGLSPARITIPALIWQYKLSAVFNKDFAAGGKGLVHLEKKSCYLYFFFQGQFLFSRRIALPETPIDDDEKINLLNYEINQSFYLFSQKTKTGVDALYFLSEEKQIIDQLSDMLNKDIIVCDEKTVTRTSDILQDDLLDVVKPFVDKEIFPHETFLSITYKPLHRKLEWQPVQNMGIAVGIFLLVFLLSEIIFLKTGFDINFHPAAFTHTNTYGNAKQALNKYSVAIDKVMEIQYRTSLDQMMVLVCASMPTQTTIKMAMLQADSPPKIKIEATIRANGPEDFKTILSEFLDNFNERLKPSAPLSEKNIDVHVDSQRTGYRNIQYVINFEAELS